MASQDVKGGLVLEDLYKNDVSQQRSLLKQSSTKATSVNILVDNESESFSSSSSSSISLDDDSPIVEDSSDDNNNNYLGSEINQKNDLDSSSNPSFTNLQSLSPEFHKKYGHFIRKNEIPRKFLHTSIGFLTLWLYTIGIELNQVTPILITLFFGISSLDFFRFNNESFNKKYCKYFGFLMREKEITQYNGIIWYLLGLIIVFILYPKDVSLMAVLLLSWSDTAASTFGRGYGHLTPKISKSKSLAGSLAAFTIGIISSILVYYYFIPVYNYRNTSEQILYNSETSYIKLPIICLLSGLIGAISEGIEIWDIDDNFTIPVISSTFLYITINLFHKK